MYFLEPAKLYRGHCAHVPSIASYGAIANHRLPGLTQHMLRNLALRLLPFLCLALWTPIPALADAMVRSQAMFANTIAEYFVEEDGVRLVLEIGSGDVGSFRNLLPDEVYERMGFGQRPYRERLQEFSSKDMAIFVGETPLAGYLVEIGPSTRVLRDGVTGEILPTNAEEAETVLIATLLFPFGEQKPDSLTLFAPNRFGTANVGFVLYHSTVAVNDFRYLTPGITANLDWEDPWYSAFSTRAMRRSYFAPMSGFLYVEPFEVRKEIIVRPKDLQRRTDLGLDGARVISAEQRGTVLEKIAGFLHDKQVVTIDGETVEPILDRVNFLNRTLKQSMVVEPGIDINLDSAVVGVIFVYPTNGLPQSATMTWDMFDERTQLVPASSVDEAGGLPTYLEPDAPILEWQNFLKNPTDPGLIDLADPPTPWALTLFRLRWWALGAAILLLVVWGRQKNAAVGGGAALVLVLVAASFVLGRPLAPPGEATDNVVNNLLRNIYKAFDYREESDIYDRLERSVSGGLLTEIYLETQSSLELANQGGARAKVQSIDMQSLDILPGEDSRSFRARATWNVNGSVGHWGHVHSRVNQYEAELDIAARDGRWKLTAMNILQEQRL